jgi:hypothetical protein
MNLTTDPREFASSHPRYALLAAALRACGLAFYADNEKLLDVVIEQASALLPKPEVDARLFPRNFVRSVVPCVVLVLPVVDADEGRDSEFSRMRVKQNMSATNPCFKPRLDPR